jgi:hypothetical protein
MNHFERTLSPTSSRKLSELTSLCLERLGIGNVPDTRSAKLLCIAKNVSSVARVAIELPVSWALAPDTFGLSCIKFSLCCLGFHHEQLCPLCNSSHRGMGHFFTCSLLPPSLRDCLGEITGLLPRLSCPYSALEVLNCPSLLSLNLTDPL